MGSIMRLCVGHGAQTWSKVSSREIRVRTQQGQVVHQPDLSQRNEIPVERQGQSSAPQLPAGRLLSHQASHVLAEEAKSQGQLLPWGLEG